MKLQLLPVRYMCASASGVPASIATPPAAARASSYSKIQEKTTYSLWKGSVVTSMRRFAASIRSFQAVPGRLPVARRLMDSRILAPALAMFLLPFLILRWSVVCQQGRCMMETKHISSQEQPVTDSRTSQWQSRDRRRHAGSDSKGNLEVRTPSSPPPHLESWIPAPSSRVANFGLPRTQQEIVAAPRPPS